MDNIRRQKKNKIHNDIRDAKTSIKHGNDTIQRLRGSKLGEEYLTKKITSLEVCISEKQQLIEKLTKDLNLVQNGGLDQEIMREYKKNQKIWNEKESERLKIKKEKEEEKRLQKEVSKDYLNKIITASRNERQNRRDINYYYRYFNRVTAELPDYMKKNLSEMPNNKGYIWRGVHFFGDLPCQPGPRIMFEKKRGGILVIHEYTKLEYRRYEKHGKNRKQLVHLEKR